LGIARNKKIFWSFKYFSKKSNCCEFIKKITWRWEKKIIFKIKLYIPFLFALRDKACILLKCMNEWKHICLFTKLNRDLKNGCRIRDSGQRKCAFADGRKDLHKAPCNSIPRVKIKKNSKMYKCAEPEQLNKWCLQKW
jgi:hypothetical protein